MATYVAVWGSHSATLDGNKVTTASSDEARRVLEDALAKTAVVRQRVPVPDEDDGDPIIDEQVVDYPRSHPLHVFATLFLLDADFVIPDEHVRLVREQGYAVSDEGLLEPVD